MSDNNLTAGQEGDAVAVYLAGIAALEQAATPGPWTLETDRDGEGDDNWEFPYGIRMPEPHTKRPDGEQHDFDYLYSELAVMGMATAEFLVAARSAVPRLLGAVEKVLALCRDTDGDYLPGESSIPVGEFIAAITAELTGKDGTDV